MNVNKVVTAIGYGVRSGTLIDLASTAVVVHTNAYGKALTCLEGAASFYASSVTAPVWALRDVIATIIGVLGFREGSNETDSKDGRNLAKHSIVNLGTALAMPFACLAGAIYPFTKLPEKVYGKLPKCLASPGDLANEFGSYYFYIGDQIGGTDVLSKLLAWIENHPALATELVAEIPEVKPFANILPILVTALRGIIANCSVPDRMNALAKRVERINTPCFATLALAAAKFHLNLYGRFSKIDSALTFCATAVSALARIISTLFLVIIAGPISLYSKAAKAFLTTQVFKLKFNSKCLAVACSATFNPEHGVRWVKSQLDEALPKGFVPFMDALSNQAQGNVHGTIQDVKNLIAFIKKIIKDGKLPNQEKLIEKVLIKMQESPETLKGVIEILQLFPQVAAVFPKELGDIAPEVFKFMEKHTDAVKSIIRLSHEGATVSAIITKIQPGNPHLMDDIRKLIPSILNTSAGSVDSLLHFAAKNPKTVKKLLPKKVAKDMLPKTEKLAVLNKFRPDLVLKMITKALQDEHPHANTLTLLAAKDPMITEILDRINWHS